MAAAGASIHELDHSIQELKKGRQAFESLRQDILASRPNINRSNFPSTSPAANGTLNLSRVSDYSAITPPSGRTKHRSGEGTGGFKNKFSENYVRELQESLAAKDDKVNLAGWTFVFLHYFSST
jgi:hypothetical protein